MCSIKKIMMLSLVIAGIVGVVMEVSAATRTWTGGGIPNGKWSNPANWGGIMPGIGDLADFSSTSMPCTLDVSDTVDGIQLSNAYTGTFCFNNNCLSISTLADFRSGGNIVIGGADTLRLIASFAKTISVPLNDTLPFLLVNATSSTISMGGSYTNLIVNGCEIIEGMLNIPAGKIFTSTNDFSVMGNGQFDASASTGVFCQKSLNIGNVAIFNAPATVLHVWGSFNKAIGGVFVHHNGSLLFETASGGNDSIYNGAPFYNVYFNRSGATWKVTGGPLKIENNVFLTSGTLDLGNGFIDSVGGTITCNSACTLSFGSSTLQIASPTVDFSSLGGILPGTGKLELLGMSSINFTPKPGVLMPEIVQNFGGTTMLNAPLRAKGITIQTGTFRLGNTYARDSVGFLRGNSGAINFDTDTLDIGDTVNLSGLSIIPGSGALRFVNSATKTFFYDGTAVLPNIIKSGIGITLVSGGHVKTNSLEVKSGTFDFGITGVNDTIYNTLAISSGAIVKLGVNNTICTQYFSASGGTLDFGNNATLDVTGLGSSDFGSLSSILPGTGTLKFSSVTPGVHYLNASNALSFPKVWSTGALDTIIVLNDLKSPYVKIDNGTWRWDNGGATGFTPQIDSIYMGGGTMNFGKSNVIVKTGNANFYNAINIIPGSGKLSFYGSVGMQQYLMPPNTGAQLPTIDVFNGSDVYLSSKDLWGDTLKLSYGTFHLNGKKVICKNMLSSGGSVDNGTDTLTITQNANFANLNSFTASTGTVCIKAESGKQAFFNPGNTTFNNLVLWANGSSSSLDTILVGTGSFSITNDLVFRHNKSASVANTAVWKFDVNNPSVTIHGNVLQEEIMNAGPSANVNLFMGSGNWTFKKNVYLPIGTGTGKNAVLEFSGITAQVCSTYIASVFDSLGTVLHSSNNLLTINSSMKCRDFSQTAGSLKFTPYMLSTSGDFSITNGDSNSLVNLDNATLNIGGNAVLNGKDGDHIMNLSPFSMWYVNMTPGKSMAASWARIGNSQIVNVTGTATNSRKTNSSVWGWNFSPMTIAWNGNASSSWKNKANWNPQFTPDDSDNVEFNTGSNSCLLDTSAFVNNITFTSGYAGNLNFSSNILTIRGNSDFRSNGTITPASGTLSFYFNSPGKRTFIPKLGATFPKIYKSGMGGSGDTLTVTVNPLIAGDFVKEYGVWDWGNHGVKHSIKGMRYNMSGAVNFGNCTLMVADTISMNSMMNPVSFSNNAAIELTKTTGVQPVSCFGGAHLPPIIHSGSATVILLDSLNCDAFQQTAGSLDLNGKNMHVYNNFVFTGGVTSLGSMDGRKISIGGNATLNGLPGDSIIIYPAAWPCTLSVGGTLQVKNAVIGRCAATGTIGYASGCRDNGNNFNWTFMAPTERRWVGLAGNNYWSSPNNWMPSSVPTATDSVVFDSTTSTMCLLNASAAAQSIYFASNYAGSFDFSGDTLTLTGVANFAYCNPGTSINGALAFSGNFSSILIPSISGSMPSIVKKDGTGSLLLSGNISHAKNVAVLSGEIQFGNNRIHSMESLYGATGGTLNFGTNSCLSIEKDVTIGAATINATIGDTLKLNGSTNQTITLPPVPTNLTLDILSSDTVKAASVGWSIDKLLLQSGMLNLGTTLTHTVNSLSCAGGSIDFSNSILRVAGDIADFSGASDVIPGIGKLTFNATAANQEIKPPALDTMPAIEHTSPTTLMVSGNPLLCNSFMQNAGTLSLNNVDILTLNDFTMTNCQALYGIDNKKITIGGNASISGVNGTPINLNPGFPWMLSVAKSFTIANATIGKCDASKSVEWPRLTNCIDAGGNKRIDFSVPTASFTNPTPNSYVNTLASISGTARDTVSGISQVYTTLKRQADNFYWSGSTWGTKVITLPAQGSMVWSYLLGNGVISDGAYVVTAQALDSASNRGSISADTFWVKSTTPSLPVVAIANNSGYTNAATVALTLLANGADSMRFMVNQDAWSSWEPFAVTKIVDIVKSGEGKKTISVMYEDKAGNTSPIASDSIVYDITAPLDATIKISDNNGFTGSSTPPISLSATGADSMQFQVNGVAFTNWALYANVKNNLDISMGGDGVKVVGVRFKDKSGNIGIVVSDTTTFDSRLPAITTIAIQDSNGFTNKVIAKVNINAVNADSMRIALPADTSVAVWKKYSQVDSISIVAGSGAVKKVLAQVKTSANAVSVWMQDSTMLDLIPPQSSIFTKGNYVTTNWPGKIIGTASDSLSGIKEFTISIASKTDSTFWNGSSWIRNSVELQMQPQAQWVYVLPGLKQGVYQVLCKTIDNAGNSQMTPDTAIIGIYKDTIAPVNNGKMVLSTIGDTALSMSIKTDSTQKDVASITIGTKNPVGGSVALVKSIPYKDTIVFLANTAIPGVWHVSMMLVDSAQNVSLALVDSVKINDRFPPVITIIGSRIISQDSAYAGRLVIADSDQNDSVSVVNMVLPRWLTFVGGNISGVPKSADIGVDTIKITVADRSGVLTTLVQTITVLSTNHAPALVSWSMQKSIGQDSTVTGRCAALDNDVGDSLSLQWITKPGWMLVISTLGTAQNPIISVSGIPTVKDTGWNTVAFSIVDKQGALLTIRDSVFVIKGYVTPITVINRQQTKLLNAAARFELSTGNKSDTSITYDVVTRSLDDTLYMKKFHTTSNVVDIYPLIDGRYEFAAYGISLAGKKDTIGIRDTFVIKGATTHVYSRPKDTTAVSWQMVSFPGKPVSITSIPGYQSLFYWDEKSGERDIYGYYRKGSEIGMTTPGAGYWRKAIDTMSAAIKRENVLDSIVEIKLNKGTMGWNQIASPFPYPVLWSQSGMLWKWNEFTKDFEDAGKVLEPWQAYWVMADSACTIKLQNRPAYITPNLAKRNVVQYIDKKHWQVRVVVTNATNSDGSNIVGFSPYAQNEYDSLDAAKPPRMADYRYMFIAHPEWMRGTKEFAHDIRKTMKPIEAYSMGFAPGTQNAIETKLQFEGVENVQSTARFYLADANGIVPIEAGKAYTIEQSNSVLYKTLFVTSDKNFLNNYPKAFSLGLPFPNPMHRRVTIQYSLPYHFGNDGIVPTAPYLLNIALYDCMGRQVRQLAFGKKDPGIYSTTWDGKSNAGRYMAAGIYFCKIQAGKFSAVKKISVIP